MNKRWSVDLKKGLEALKTARFDEALERFSSAYAKSPATPMVRYALGREYARAGRFEEAKPLLRTAWLQDSTLVGAAATLARCLGLAERDFAAADEVLTAARKSGVDVATLDIVEAELLIERGDFESARSAAARALVGQSSEAVAQGAAAIRTRADNLEGLTLADNGDHEAALFLFRRAQIGDPQWPAPHINSALSFEALGRPQAALTAAGAALSLDPDNGEAIALHARLLFHNGQGNEATIELASALEANPEDKAIAMMLAELSARGGDVETAAAILADLLAQDPTDCDAWLRLGRAQLGAAAIGSAEECFRQALELDPGNSDAMTLLADLLVRDGRLGEAAAMAELALTLAPPPRPR